MVIWQVRRGTGLFVLFGQSSLAAWMIVIRGNAKSPVRDVRLESFRGTIETAEPIDVKAVEGQVIDRFDVSSGNVGKPQGTCDFK